MHKNQINIKLLNKFNIKTCIINNVNIKILVKVVCLKFKVHVNTKKTKPPEKFYPVNAIPEELVKLD